MGWQYLLFAAEPYETIAFKVPSREVDKSDHRFWSHWNRETKEFFLQFSFKLLDSRSGNRPPAPALVPNPARQVLLHLVYLLLQDHLVRVGYLRPQISTQRPHLQLDCEFLEIVLTFIF